MNAQILQLFPTPIYRGIAEGIIPKLQAVEDEIDKIKAADLAKARGTDLEQVYIWEQYTTFFTDQHLHNHAWFAPVEAEIMAHAQAFKKSLALDSGDRRLKIQTAFANVMDKPFHQHGRHIHHGAVFSGVIYIRTSGDTGQISFEHPANDHFMQNFNFTEKSLLNSSTVSISPNAGEIIIFLSHTPHRVEQSFTEDKRVAISFNLVFE